MSVEIKGMRISGPTRPSDHARPGRGDAYEELLQGDTLALVVTRFDGAQMNHVASFRLELNRPLMSLLRTERSRRLCWSPIWWKDGAEPYGRVFLRGSGPERFRRRDTYRRVLIRKSYTHFFLLGGSMVQLWFPVPAITHYAVTTFTPHVRGVAFSPLDGFQRYHSLRYRPGVLRAGGNPDGLGSVPELGGTRPTSTSMPTTTSPTENFGLPGYMNDSTGNPPCLIGELGLPR